VVSAVGLLLSACDTPPSTTSTLQRFDRLRPQLSYVGHASSNLAVDMSNINRQMQRDSVAGIRERAARLRQDGLRFARRAGRIGNEVRALAREESSATDRRYYALIADALSCQWLEGMALARLADIVWRDPLLLNRRDETRFSKVQGRAARYAWVAVLRTGRANGLRRHFPRSFRYIPVAVATAASGQR